MSLHYSNNNTSFGGGSFAGAGAGGAWGDNTIILPEISIFADKDKFIKLSLFLFALLLYLIKTK